MMNRKFRFSRTNVIFVILNMFRVLLKIDRVNIRIKEPVEIHIIIKKKQEYFTHCKHQMLVNGQATLKNTSQFFVSTKDASFQIEIYLLTGAIRKKGGNIQLNLSNYTLNDSHRITSVIQNTPLHNSTMLIDFAYMLSESPFSSRLLVSLNQLQDIKHKQHLKNLSQEGKQLALQNERLAQEVSQLKVKNQGLKLESESLEEENVKREITFKKEISKMEQEKYMNFKTLFNEKKRVAEIVDIINQSGNPVLINQMGDLISKKQESQNF